MIESFSAAAMDVLQDRILPLILARVGQAVVDPDSWGVMELVVVGLFTQIGLEVYKHGVPEVFSRWKHLPARGKPLEVLESRDRQYIAFSQIAIVVMTFHYLQAGAGPLTCTRTRPRPPESDPEPEPEPELGPYP